MAGDVEVAHDEVASPVFVSVCRLNVVTFCVRIVICDRPKPRFSVLGPGPSVFVLGSRFLSGFHGFYRVHVNEVVVCCSGVCFC